MKVSIIIPTMPKNSAYLELCVESLRRNTRAFEYEILPALNGAGTPFPQGQCQAVNRESLVADGDWLMVTNDDMYFAPGWDTFVDFEKSPCWSPNLMEPAEQGSAPPFLKCDAGFTLDVFNQEKVDEMVGSYWTNTQGWETGFNLPFFIRRDLWETIGGYDTMYDPWGSNSDSDLQTKIDLAGVQPMRNRDVLVYHFSNKSGTFDGSHQLEWQRNWDYYIQKWGFPRVDSPDIWYARNVIDHSRLKWHPIWKGLYA